MHYRPSKIIEDNIRCSNACAGFEFFTVLRKRSLSGGQNLKLAPSAINNHLSQFAPFACRKCNDYAEISKTVLFLQRALIETDSSVLSLIYQSRRLRRIAEDDLQPCWRSHGRNVVEKPHLGLTVDNSRPHDQAMYDTDVIRIQSQVYDSSK
jgi:hypothetical protein